MITEVVFVFLLNYNVGEEKIEINIKKKKTKLNTIFQKIFVKVIQTFKLLMVLKKLMNHQSPMQMVQAVALLC